MIIIIILLAYYYTLSFSYSDQVQHYSSSNRYHVGSKKQFEHCKYQLLKRHGDRIVRLGVFNTLRQTKDIATYPIKTELAPLCKIFKKQSLYQYEYKNRLDPFDNNPLHQMILSYLKSFHILSRLQQDNNVTLKVRICSGNWKFNSHFDCITNLVFMLYAWFNNKTIQYKIKGTQI